MKTASPASGREGARERDRFQAAIEELWQVGVVALGPINTGVDRAHEALAENVGKRFPGGMGSYLFWTATDACSFVGDGSLLRPLTLHCSSDEVAATAVALLQEQGADAAATPETATVIVFPRALARGACRGAC